MLGFSHFARVSLVHASRPIQTSFIRQLPSRSTRFFAEGPSPNLTKPTVPLEPRPTSHFLRRSLLVAKYTSYLVLSATAGVLALGAGIFIHDAFTYTDKHVNRVPVSPLALHPERGGPKNLPVVNALLTDEEDEEFRKLNEKPKLVIVGGGWGVRGMDLPSIRDSQTNLTPRLFRSCKTCRLGSTTSLLWLQKPSRRSLLSYHVRLPESFQLPLLDLFVLQLPRWVRYKFVA
jgi:hypothetical protein